MKKSLLLLIILAALAAPVSALLPNGTKTAILTQPNLAVNFRDRIESLAGCTVFYEILATAPVATGKDSLPVYIHLTTPETAVTQDFRYRVALRNLSENGRLVFGPVVSSSGARALIRINCWIDPADRYVLSVQCPPSYKSGIWKDWKPQLWSTFRASHSQFYDYSYPLR